LENGRLRNFKAKVSEQRQRPEKDEDGAGCMNGSVVDLHFGKHVYSHPRLMAMSVAIFSWRKVGGRRFL